MNNLNNKKAINRFWDGIDPTSGLPSPVLDDLSLPLISIVTPSYNQGEYIQDTIESVLSQDYPNIEYWVIDGGSTDATLVILEEYQADPRFNWISEPDKGQSDAINKGLTRCQGEIFIWLNSDDLLLPDALSTVASKWVDARHPAIIYGFARHIDENGKDLGCCPFQSSQMTFSKLLECRSTFMQPATFIPTAAVRELGGVDVELQYTMDFDLWVKLAEHLPIIQVSKDLALYRLHSASKTVANPTDFIDDFGKVLTKAVKKGHLSKNQMMVRTNFFAAKVYLSSGSRPDFMKALNHLRIAISNNYLSIFEGSLILGKNLMRFVLGEKNWSKVRFLRARMSL